MNTKREWRPGEREEAHRIGLVFARKPWPGFDAAVQEYRQIEAEIIASRNLDEFLLLELKRRIAEWIVRSAWRDDVPFEQFQDAWNGLLALRFTDDEKKLQMVFYYADYCLSNEHYDAGLGVIEPIIAEFEEWLPGAVLEPKLRKFYEDALESKKYIRDGLIALRAGGAEAEAWLALDDARQPSPQTLRKQDLDLELSRAMRAIRDTSLDRSFAEVERAYRQLETDFLARLQPDDESFVPEVKQRIANDIFVRAHEDRESFEVCHDLWNELRPWDFGHLEIKCEMIRRYAECCLFNGLLDAGLAVVEPLLAKLKQDIDAGTDDDMASESYPEEIGRLEKLRDELKPPQK